MIGQGEGRDFGKLCRLYDHKWDQYLEVCGCAL